MIWSQRDSPNPRSWTVADSIHITACAKNILVQRNIIGHSGDDAIAMVTYGVGPNTCFVQNIEIAENYAYNGIYSRGITCIGCKNALIRDNTVVNSTNAAVRELMNNCSSLLYLTPYISLACIALAVFRGILQYFMLAQCKSHQKHSVAHGIRFQ